MRDGQTDGAVLPVMHVRVLLGEGLSVNDKTQLALFLVSVSTLY